MAGTQGLNITGLATLPFANGGITYTAAYSLTTHEILILKNSSVVDRIEAFEGLPSGQLQLTWYPYTENSVAHLVLVAAGSDATVEVPIDTWIAAPRPDHYRHL